MNLHQEPYLIADSYHEDITIYKLDVSTYPICFTIQQRPAEGGVAGVPKIFWSSPAQTAQKLKFSNIFPKKHWNTDEYNCK
jgi:hypothetical protein